MISYALCSFDELNQLFRRFRHRSSAIAEFVARLAFVYFISFFIDNSEETMLCHSIMIGVFEIDIDCPQARCC